MTDLVGGFKPYATENFSKMPEVSFAISKENDIFEYNSTSNKVKRVAFLIFSIIVVPVGLVRLIGHVINKLCVKNGMVPATQYSKEECDELRNQHLMGSRNPQLFERIAVKTADGVKIDSMFLKNEQNQEKPIGEQKFILFFNGNGGLYESMLPFMEVLAEETGANVYCGNYRGVGYSESFPLGYQDLVMDGEALFQQLLSKGAKPENILIHGHSLGGGVGAMVASHHQEKGHEVRFCHDRSFSTMAQEVDELFSSVKNKISTRTCLGKVIKAGMCVLIPMAVFATKTLGWNFPSLTAYKKINGYKFILVHKEDKVIPKFASLVENLKTSEMTTEEKVAKLRRKTEKAKLRQQGLDVEKLNAVRRYHPKNVVWLKNTDRFEEIPSNRSHAYPLNRTAEFTAYKEHVKMAFAAA
jgi:hypothetical protein